MPLLKKNKKYIEEKAQEALALDTEGTITDQLLEESAKDEEMQSGDSGSDMAALPDVAVSAASDSPVNPATENIAPVATAKQSIDITV